MNLINDFIYNSMLDVIVKSENPNVELAWTIFSDAVNKGYATIVSYNLMIETIARSEKPDVEQAIEIYNELVKNNLKADLITYNALFDVIARSDQPTDTSIVKTLLSQALPNFYLTKIEIIDLHYLSFGLSYYWLKEQLSIWLSQAKENEQFRFSLIVGRSSHSNNTFNSLREGVTKILKEMESYMTLTITTEHDDGLWNIDAVKNLKQIETKSNEIISQPYTSQYNSGFTFYSETTSTFNSQGLKADAKEFIPYKKTI